MSDLMPSMNVKCEVTVWQGDGWVG